MEMKMNLENEKAYQEASLSKEHYRAGIKDSGEREYFSTGALRPADA